jgi:hypothetical protein
MTEKDSSQDNLRELAEDAMAEKQEETGDDAQARELWDVPTEPAGVLADQQREDD